MIECTRKNKNKRVEKTRKKENNKREETGFLFFFLWQRAQNERWAKGSQRRQKTKVSVSSQRILIRENVPDEIRYNSKLRANQRSKAKTERCIKEKTEKFK